MPTSFAPFERLRIRLPRDYNVRVFGNDHSVDPVAIGRMVEVVADLEQVRVHLGAAWSPSTRGRGATPSRSPTRPRHDCVFGDQVVAAAMIDRIVHHAEVITLKGTDSATPGSTPCLRQSREHGTLARPAHRFERQR